MRKVLLVLILLMLLAATAVTSADTINERALTDQELDETTVVDVPTDRPVMTRILESWHGDTQITGTHPRAVSGSTSSAANVDAPRPETPPGADLSDARVKAELRTEILSGDGHLAVRAQYGLDADPGYEARAANVPPAELWGPGLLMGLVLWGDDADAMKRRIIALRAFEQLVPEVREQLGDDFTAAWVDHQSGGTISVSASAATELDRVVADLRAKLRWSVEGVVVGWSERDLLEARAAALGSIPPGDVTDSRIDAIAGVVEIGVRHDQVAAARQAIADLETLVVVSASAPASAEARDSAQAINGGVRSRTAASNLRCTWSYTARDGTSANLALTAGHCSFVDRTIAPTGDPAPRIARPQYDSLADPFASLTQVTSDFATYRTPTWATSGTDCVYFTSSVCVSIEGYAAYSVTLNDVVCISGASTDVTNTDETCAAVTDLAGSYTSSPKNYVMTGPRAEYCATSGDSGAPIYQINPITGSSDLRVGW